ncbi:MAG TPA: hypothetical protein VFE37_12990 [Chloroflexota bacterium]|nr:hypothetical protein [Chloroflexota bacterium]
MPPGLPIAGVVLADHVKSLDWRVRRREFAGVAAPELLIEVVARLLPLIEGA